MDLGIILNDSGANVMTSGLVNLSVLSNKSVVVNAADGTSKTYNFILDVIKQDDASVKSLSVKVDGVEKNINVNAPLNNTVIELDYASSYSVDILAIANDNQGSIVSGNSSNNTLKIGDNSFTVISQAQNGVQKTYTINIKVKVGSKLEVDVDGKDWLVDPSDPIEDHTNPGEKDSVDSSIDIFRSHINVKYQKESFGLSDLTYNKPAGSIVTVIKTATPLKVGLDNEFIFEVKTADSKSTARYIVSINRAENDESKLVGNLGINNGSAWLSDINNPISDNSNNNETDVNDASIKIFRHSVDVKYDKTTFTKSDLTYVLPANADYVAVSNDPLSLSVGLKNEFVFEVLSQDKKSTSRYIVSVNRQEDQNTKLENLDIKDGQDWLKDPSKPIADISKPGGEKVKNDPTIDIYRYEVYVKNSKIMFGMNDLNIVENPNMNINVLTSDPLSLSVGANNSFIFEQVNSDKSSTSRYIITIHREEPFVADMPLLDRILINGVF
ncbi:MAG: hypothetical protein GX760_05090, partial [Erysipelothrix sp.]|nr:hypothetical protein [Erysipelothrix sp.]